MVKNNKKEVLKNNKIDFSSFASEFLFEKLNSIAKTSEGIINVALSGGSTPIPILEKLKKKELNWDKFNFFLVDERCVLLSNSQSNFGVIDNVFFKEVSSRSFSIIQNDMSIDDSVECYKKSISETVSVEKNGFPKFDLILLGMGNDGHTASLFPNSKALLEENELVVRNKLSNNATERITLTYPVILNADEIIVMIVGDFKESMVEELYSKKPKNYPILKIVNNHENLKWLIG